jgi:imidazolonepropionase-like amidohydrolase
MRHRVSLAFMLLSLCACGPTEEGHMKAIIGAVLIDGAGGPPLSSSVVVVAGERIRAAGGQSTIPIPSEADKIDGSGKFLVPALVDVYSRAMPASAFTAGHPATAEEARARVADLAKSKAGAIHIWKMDPAIAEAALEAARDAGIPVVGHVSSQADAKFLVANGASGFVGMITDTENLDSEFVTRLRDLRILFAPALVTAGPQLEIAKRNTRRLFQAGVPIALASNGGDAQREVELLAEAGLPPLDAIVAATRNGTIQQGKPANLLLLSANPGEDVRNLRRVALRMSDGQWVR